MSRLIVVAIEQLAYVGLIPDIAENGQIAVAKAKQKYA